MTATIKWIKELIYGGTHAIRILWRHEKKYGNSLSIDLERCHNVQREWNERKCSMWNYFAFAIVLHVISQRGGQNLEEYNQTSLSGYFWILLSISYCFYTFLQWICVDFYIRRNKDVFLCLYWVPFDPVTTLRGIKQKKLRLRKAKWLAQHHPAVKGMLQSSRPVYLTQRSVLQYAHYIL